MISLSFVAALIAAAVLVSAAIVAAVGFGRAARRASVKAAALAAGDKYDQISAHGVRGEAKFDLWSSVVCYGLAAVIAGAFAIGLYPYDMEYHRYDLRSGVVAEVGVRMLADGKATSQAYAVRLTDGQTYRCDDTRCSLLKPGDSVSLRCIRVWEYGSTGGWRCRFVDSRRGEQG